MLGDFLLVDLHVPDAFLKPVDAFNIAGSGRTSWQNPAELLSRAKLKFNLVVRARCFLLNARRFEATFSIEPSRIDAIPVFGRNLLHDRQLNVVLFRIVVLEDLVNVPVIILDEHFNAI